MLAVIALGDLGVWRSGDFVLCGAALSLEAKLKVMNTWLANRMPPVWKEGAVSTRLFFFYTANTVHAHVLLHGGTVSVG